MKFVIAFAILISAVTIEREFAQAKQPDLSGHWIVDPPLGESDPRVPICNRECFLTQTADALTVREQRTPKILSPAILFKFDGSPTSPPPPEPGRTGGPVLVFRSNWKDEVLVIASEVGAYRTVARLSLREGRLVIEGERAAPFPVFKATYRKGSEK